MKVIAFLLKTTKSQETRCTCEVENDLAAKAPRKTLAPEFLAQTLCLPTSFFNEMSHCSRVSHGFAPRGSLRFLAFSRNAPFSLYH